MAAVCATFSRWKDRRSRAFSIAARVIVAVLFATPLAFAADDIPIADFEGDTYGAWTATGDAFGSGPARGTLPGQMRVQGFQGRGLVNTFRGGDGPTGTLLSPEFTIERPYISFLIGGGKDLEKTALHLVVEGTVARRATGPEDRSGGIETLEPGHWAVAEFVGRKAVIRIIDAASGGWGHVAVDEIVQTDRRPPVLAPAAREFRVEKRFLAIPIKNGAPKRNVTAMVDGRPAVRNQIELADAEPDWWAVMEAGRWKGKTVALEVDKLPDDSQALTAIRHIDAIAGELEGTENLYREPLRGQFHFSPRRGWNNDPNGCVFFGGEYHLFFQHNPYGRGWGNMHWGHAVSRDLVHWEELGDALFPDDMGPMYSGSAVVDTANTSGLGPAGSSPLVLCYTAAGKPYVQCIAWSTDGRTFTKHAGNPVVKEITHGNRDPKVFWHEPTKRWVMVLYVELPGKRHSMHFLTSPNLREWKPASVTEGLPGTKYLYECPDFFELAVDGDPARKKWVLLGANTEYAIGAFDGVSFAPEATRLPGHRGKGFYAAQSFNDVPDGRRLFIGWWQTPTEGMPFSQSMSLPLELGLKSTVDGPRLTFAPAREVEGLRGKSHSLGGSSLSPGGANPLAGVAAELVELRAEIEPGSAVEAVFTVRGATIAYDVKRQELVVEGQRAAAPLVDGRLRLVVFCDRTGLEVFAADGLCYVPLPFQPRPDDRSLAIAARGGTATIAKLDVHELKSIWKGEPAPHRQPSP
jgi:fructan beta-fructosidase